MTLHWQKRGFSNQEQLNLRRIKSAEKGLFLWCGWAAKECLLPASLKPARSVLPRAAEVSPWPVQLVLLAPCGVLSFNKTLCPSVFGKVPATGDKGLSPYLSENSFHRHKRKQGVT